MLQQVERRIEKQTHSYIRNIEANLLVEVELAFTL